MQRCRGGCGTVIHGGPNVACRPCWERVPLELRRDYRAAVHGWSQDGTRARATKREIHAEIERWWDENPPPKPESREPLWRRPR